MQFLVLHIDNENPHFGLNCAPIDIRDWDLPLAELHAKREAQELEGRLEEIRERAKAANAAKKSIIQKQAENEVLARALHDVEMTTSKLREQVLVLCSKSPAIEVNVTSCRSEYGAFICR